MCERVYACVCVRVCVCECVCDCMHACVYVIWGGVVVQRSGVLLPLDTASSLLPAAAPAVPPTHPEHSNKSQMPLKTQKVCAVGPICMPCLQSSHITFNLVVLACSV
jgi:hypothetical protein